MWDTCLPVSVWHCNYYATRQTHFPCWLPLLPVLLFQLPNKTYICRQQVIAKVNGSLSLISKPDWVQGFWVWKEDVFLYFSPPVVFFICFFASFVCLFLPFQISNIYKDVGASFHCSWFEFLVQFLSPASS